MIGDAIYDVKKKFIHWNLNTNLNGNIKPKIQ